MTPNDLRQRNRRIRLEISPDDLDIAAGDLCNRIIELAEYRRASKIAAYYAVNGEISLEEVIAHALGLGKKIYLPNLDQKSLRFSPYFDGQKMRINYFKLPEPDVDDEQMLQPDELDLVLAPLVVFDAQCNRIGMGGGFYDRSFAFRKQGVDKPVLIGVAHEVQKVDQLIPEEWDVRLDKVVTDQAVYD
ncbi:MAG: 5-formyltetrahydrofolate cyclo-ligase [Gammaproteobacteria bacterium]|nr:5-formyltetrahydrofolate cyclo-ligase [Gammaproteobacteria bacterium]